MKQNPVPKQKKTQNNTKIDLSPHFPYSIEFNSMLLTDKPQTHPFNEEYL